MIEHSQRPWLGGERSWEDSLKVKTNKRKEKIVICERIFLVGSDLQLNCKVVFQVSEREERRGKIEIKAKKMVVLITIHTCIH